DDSDRSQHPCAHRRSRFSAVCRNHSPCAFRLVCQLLAGSDSARYFGWELHAWTAMVLQTVVPFARLTHPAGSRPMSATRFSKARQQIRSTLIILYRRVFSISSPLLPRCVLTAIVLAASGVTVPASAATPEAPQAAAPGPSFDADILPIFRKH